MLARRHASEINRRAAAIGRDTVSRHCLLAAVLFSTSVLAPSATASDGQVLINDKKALAGNVTPGDTPGYPVTLSVQGSYKLSGNLSAPPGVNGIDAVAVEITIDLNGFRIEGSNEGDIGILGTQRNLRVRNGTIQRFKRGIQGGGSAILEDLRISENRKAGIDIRDGYARVTRSTIILTSDGNGINCFINAVCHIESSLIALNGNTGVAIAGGMLRGNTVMNNKNYGVVPAFSNTVGLGGNTIAGNLGGQIGGGYIAGMKNACVPACP
jgi:hypothetical protein